MINKSDFLKGIKGQNVTLEVEDVGQVVVKGLSVDELQEIQGLANGDDLRAALLTIIYGLVEPKLDIEDIDFVKSATPKVVNTIATKISELSGLGKPSDSP
jgi:hypothetical protein